MGPEAPTPRAPCLAHARLTPTPLMRRRSTLRPRPLLNPCPSREPPLLTHRPLAVGGACNAKNGLHLVNSWPNTGCMRMALAMPIFAAVVLQSRGKAGARLYICSRKPVNHSACAHQHVNTCNSNRRHSQLVRQRAVLREAGLRQRTSHAAPRKLGLKRVTRRATPPALAPAPAPTSFGALQTALLAAARPLRLIWRHHQRPRLQRRSYPRLQRRLHPRLQRRFTRPQRRERLQWRLQRLQRRLQSRLQRSLQPRLQRRPPSRLQRRPPSRLQWRQIRWRPTRCNAACSAAQ